MMFHPTPVQLHGVIYHPTLFSPVEVSSGYIGMGTRLMVWDWPASARPQVSLIRLEDADGWSLTLNSGLYARHELAPAERRLFTAARPGGWVRAYQILKGPFQGHTLIERTGMNSAAELRSAGYTQAVIDAEQQVGVRRDPLAAYVLSTTSFCARKRVWCAP